MIVSISLKHAKGSTGASGKASSHENNVILRSEYGSPVIIKESNDVVIKLILNPYGYDSIDMYKAVKFGDPYNVVPPGTVLSLTQNSILTG